MSCYLVVSAWWPEQRLLHALVNEARVIEVRAPVVAISQFENDALKNVARGDVAHEIDFVCCGIGPVNAAVEVAHALKRRRYERVIFCATAGCYVGGVSGAAAVGEIPRVERCSRVVASDVGVMEGKSYLVGEKKVTDAIEFGVGNGDGNRDGTELKTCLSTFSITRDDDVAKKMSAFAQFENLEFYGVAAACKRADHVCDAVFGISNVVGKNSHAEWKNFHLQAAVMAQVAVYSDLVNSK